MSDRRTINRKFVTPLSVDFNESVTYCLLHSVNFGDQFLVILCNFLDPRKTVHFDFQYAKWLENEQM